MLEPEEEDENPATGCHQEKGIGVSSISASLSWDVPSGGGDEGAEASEQLAVWIEERVYVFFM